MVKRTWKISNCSSAKNSQREANDFSEVRNNVLDSLREFFSESFEAVDTFLKSIKTFINFEKAQILQRFMQHAIVAPIKDISAMREWDPTAPAMICSL